MNARLLSILPISLLVLAVTSCSTVLDKPINRNTLAADINEARASDLIDSTTAENLDWYVQRFTDVDAFKKQWHGLFDEEYGSSNVEASLLSDARYDSLTSAHFKMLEQEKVTVGNLVDEIMKRDRINQRYDSIAQGLYERIDDACTTEQKHREEIERTASAIKDSLNHMIGVELVSVRQTEYDYRDVVEVRFKLTSLSGQKIEAVGFTVVLRDNLGDELATLHCKSNDSFSGSSIAAYAYSRYDRSDIYDKLENVSASFVTIVPSITRANIGGNIISAYANEDLESTINLTYVRPDDLIGYCPYLNDDDPLMKERQELKDLQVAEVKKACPLLERFSGLSEKLTDGMVETLVRLKFGSLLGD